jgi:N-formylglutamate deformylase
MSAPYWLAVTRGEAPLLVSIPHTGTDLAGLDARLVSPWLARKDADWHIEKLYDFAAGLGATVVRTSISRTVIDVNRDPSGASLYPGQATTGLCPVESFDGEPLYRDGQEPGAAEITERGQTYFNPYHDALAAEIARLGALHGRVVAYDCHSIRSIVPRLFDGELPVFNLGTNGGASADPELERLIVRQLEASGRSFVVNGRFRGGWITRHYGRPKDGVHAVQMEIACRGYLREPLGTVDEADWPVDYDTAHARPLRDELAAILQSAIEWAGGPSKSVKGSDPS